MPADFRLVSFLILTLVFLFAIGVANAQAQLRLPTRHLITQSIDETAAVRLSGNTRAEANAANDRGIVSDSVPMEHMQLQLRLPAEKEQELDQLIADLHNPASPNFHKWLTAEQFNEEFSLAPEDIGAITSWLQTHGFTVNVVYPRSIDFSGTAGQVRGAFKTEIHNLEVNGERHIANVSDPQIPAALAPALAGVVSMNDFMPHPLHRQRAADTVGNGYYTVVPADLATIYNFNPLFAKGTSGQGQTIVVVEDTDVYSTADWNTFRSVLGLSGYASGSFTQVHPAPPSGTNNCSDPGVNGDDGEAILDAEWASAGAPNAAIELVSCTNTTNFGGFIALQNILNASGTPPGIVSISYGESEPDLGAAGNAYINALYQQAVTEGVSVFVASGDAGAASSDSGATNATHGVTISGFASTPYNVAVGGTDFGDTYAGTNSTYWNSANTAAYGSAKSYIPEIPWNNSCAGGLLTAYFTYLTSYGSGGFCNSSTGKTDYLNTVAGSGGPSGCATGAPSTGGVISGSCAGYAKPSWQAIFGNPSDGMRDIPDISLFAANGLWGHYYVVCYSDTSGGGAACTGNPNTWSGFGGTSLSSPIMASVQALINQTIGNSSGNPNPTYYSLAASEFGATGNTSCNSTLGNGVAGSCIFYDVTQGDVDVVCKGSHNCYLPSGTYGVLSKSNSSYQPDFGADTGWDFATGIGSVNVANLVNAWPKSSNPAVLSITKTHTGNFTQGQQNAIYTVMVSNAAGAGPTSGTITVTETAPTGLTLVSMAGTGWTCVTNTCTRSDALNGGLNYPAITVTVNVASNASSPQLNSVGVSGGGSATAAASDSTAINSNPAVLSITKTHTGNFTQGQQNAVYTVTVSNAAGAGSTSGTVTVTETVPAGLTLVSMTGSGWTCAVSTCTRNDALSAGSNYPTIAVTVNVAAGAGSPQVNSVLVSGGGSTSANAADSTTITALSSVVATFVTVDTITQGSWQGKYGADGYAIASYAQSLPSYATFTPQNTLLWTWASSTSDVRALRLPNSSQRAASTWYNNPSFSYDVNITDGNTHQIALYALDWDSPGGLRSEMVQIVDGNNPSHVLDTETLLSYASGTYLVWNISGHVTINVTRTGGANAVISGVFFGAPPQAAPAITSASSVTFVVGSPGAFSVMATGSPTPTLSESGALPSGVTFNAATGALSGTPATGSSGSYPLTFAASNGVGANATQSFTLTVNPAPVGGSGVTFVGFDTTTQGNWQGKYGADGYSIANYAQSLPSYATFTPQSALLWTWASSTSDLRALKIPNSSQGIASTWYNNPSFSYDVNFTDGNTHQIALYALDWDSPGGVRSENVQIVDGNNPSHVLDAETLLSYTSGTYLVWNISGHVTINVILTGGANAVISGAFFGAPPQTAPAITSASSVTFAVGSPGSFTVTATGSPAPTLSESGALPSGVTFNASTGVLSGTPAAGTNGSYSLTFTVSNGVNPNATQNFILTVNQAPAGPTATFGGQDWATQGNWQRKYGADGYSIASYVQSLPSYVTFTPQNALLWTWSSSTSDVRALELPNSSLGVASTWYNNPSYSYDMNITDGNAHQIALYALDWDSQGARAETIQIVDANNPSNVLDSESVSNYQNGVYLVWTISGHVTIKVIRTGGPNAVVSGVFFK